VNAKAVTNGRENHESARIDTNFHESIQIFSREFAMKHHSISHLLFVKIRVDS
jgi:hypothetical protein